MNRTHVISSGASFFFQSSGNRAVLGLHGYTGYPHDLRHIASVLHAEGYAVHVPRLPGHATNAADFLKSSAHDWLTRAYNAYLDLCVTYEEVHVLGFSMGGLLALLLAARCDIEKLILIAPALSVRDKNIRYTPLLWPFLHKIRNNPVFNGSSADQKIMYEEYWKWSYIKNVAQFYKLQKQARNVLPDVQSDMLVIVSETDETVPPDVAPYIRKRSSARSYESITLSASPHVSLDELAPERDTVAAGIISWLLKKDVTE